MKTAKTVAITTSATAVVQIGLWALLLLAVVVSPLMEEIMFGNPLTAIIGGLAGGPGDLPEL